jgi:dihydrolipoamide dehydrogenase
MYDLVIIGAGWAGFNAAMRAKELGLKIAIIEKSQIGGTCLNLGCIPTKSLLHSVKVFNTFKKSLDFGVSNLNPSFDISLAIKRKKEVVDSLRSGMTFMLKGIDIIKGEAVLVSSNSIEVGKDLLKTKFIIIATGSMPLELNTLKFDTKKIISSNEALSLSEVPPSILIIGGGVVGCEFADLFSGIGTEVTIVEKEQRLLPLEDKDLSFRLEYFFKKKNINVKTDYDYSSLNLEDYNYVLVSIGRKPVSSLKGLKELGVRTQGGRIITDDFLKTDVENIYAAGDCASEVMLAHLAGYQGRIAVDNIFKGKNKQKTTPSIIPNIIFTDPQIASAGLTEDKAKEEGVRFKVSKFDFMASGMARILGETKGFLKIISDEDTGLLLGFSIIAPMASEVSAALTLAISSGLKEEDIHSTIFAHPTISESIGEVFKQN